jgi:hypothetical protein
MAKRPDWNGGRKILTNWDSRPLEKRAEQFDVAAPAPDAQPLTQPAFRAGILKDT